MIGPPAGKADVLDDASQDFLLLIQDQDDALSAALERHLADYHNPAVYRLPGRSPVNPQAVAMRQPVGNALANARRYLRLPAAERTPVPARRDRERRRRQFGKNLSAKRRRRPCGEHLRDRRIGGIRPPRPSA